MNLSPFYNTLKFYFQIFLMFLFTGLLYSCGPTKNLSQVAEPKAKTYRFHSVEKGETLGKIAGTYNITQEQIKILNPGIDFNKLKIGQEIKVPYQKPEVVTEKTEEQKEAVTPKKITLTKIALLLPFNAYEFVVGNQTDNEETGIDPSGIPWIHLYQGVQMALDSLSTPENRYQLTLFDSGMDSTRLNWYIRDSILKTNDLVISAAGPSWIPQLTTAASKNNTPLVVTQNNSAVFLDHQPALYLTSPSVALQCQMMSNFLFKNFGKENLVILHQDNKKENDLASLFSTGLEIAQLKSGSGDSLHVKNLVYAAKLFDKGNKVLDRNKNNVIIIPSSDEAFVSPIISRLDSLKDFRYTICGLPTWENFESIDPKKLQNLHTHIFSSTYIDFNSEPVNSFRKSFVEKYKSDPVYNAYMGFSIAYNTGNALKNYSRSGFDRGMEKTDTKNYPVTFDFVSKSNNDGKENHHFNILKFENFKLVKVE